MNQLLAETIQQLADLDRRQAYGELSSALGRLPAALPEEHQADVAYWLGKLALLDGDIPAAVAQLAITVQLEPHQGHALYLLGSALVRSQQWLDARAVLQQARQQRPGQASLCLELAAVHAALGQPHEALDLLEPLADHPSASMQMQSVRIKLAVQTSDDLQEAAAIAASALARNIRLPQTVVVEWLQISGALLLADRFVEGRAWLLALTTRTPTTEAIANPVPRRIALTALLALELLQPSGEDVLPWMQELRNLRWLPPSATEHQLWTSWLEPFLNLVAGRLEDQVDRDHDRCRLVLKEIQAAVSAMRPPILQAGFELRLEMLRQGCKPDVPVEAERLALALKRHSTDWLALMDLFEQCLQLEDRPLLKLRPDLEHHMEREPENSSSNQTGRASARRAQAQVTQTK